MPIQKLNAVPEITALPEIQPIQPLQAVPKITALPSLAEQNTTQSLYANYNDPYEINSFADAILNTEAIKKASEDWGWFSWVGDVPILREIGAVIDLAWNKGIKPAIQGDWKAVGINTLINLGETLGAPGNVIKGLLMGGPQGAWNALGLWNPEGRTNYDWDTGSWVADIGLEIITDPLTWISFGSSAAISSGAKAISKAALEGTTKQISTWAARTISRRAGEQVAIETARESGERIARKVARTASRTLIDYTTGAIEREADRMARQLSRRGIERSRDEIITDILNSRNNQLRDLIINEIIKDLPENAKAILQDTTSRTYQELVRRIDSILSSVRWDNMAQQINRTTSTLYRATNSFDRFLFQSTMYTSGLGLGYLAFKAIKRPTGEFINNTILRNLRRARLLTTANIVDIKNYEQARRIYSESYKVAKTLDTDVERSTDTFIRLVDNQFLTDRTQMGDILKRKRNDPATSSLALSNYVRKRYGVASFNDYVNLIKEINELEEGYYNTHVQFLNRVQTRMERMLPLQKLLKGGSIRGVENLFSEQTVERSIRNYTKTIKEATRISQQNSENPMPATIKYFADTQYQQIKYNELYRQAMLLKDPIVYKLITDIYAGSEGTVGALIKNILSDPSAYGKETYEIAKILNDTAYNVKAFDEFITDIYNGIYSKVVHVSDNNFKLTLLDILYSFGSTKAIDVISNPETMGSLLKSKLEEVFNARYKTGDKNRIYIPDENITIIQEQLVRYAETVIEQNPNSLLFYPLDKSFTRNLSEFRNVMLRNEFDVQQINESIDAILLVYSRIRRFNQEQPILRKNIFEENKSLNASYDTGPVNIIDSLTEGLEGTALYSVRQAIDTTNLNKYFNFEEGAEYSIDLIKNSSKFMETITQYSKRIDEKRLEKILKNILPKYLNINRLTKNILEGLQENIDILETPSLSFMLYLKTDEFSAIESFSILRYLYNLYSQRNGGVVIRRLFSVLKEDLPDLLKLIQNPKTVFRQTALKYYNPQKILRSIGDIDFREDTRVILRDYDELQNSKSFNTFTEDLKRRSKTSPMVQVCERKNRIYSSFNKNVLNYTRNKMQKLFNRYRANQILKQTSTILNESDQQILRQFYSNNFISDLVEDADILRITNILKEKAPSINLDAPFEKQRQFNRQLKRAQEQLNVQQLMHFIALSPEDMLNDLCFRARTGVIFDSGVGLSKKQLNTIKQQLNYKSEELKKLGVEVYQDPNTELVYIYINKKHRVEYRDTRVFLDGIEVTRKVNHLDYSIFKTFDEQLYREFSKLENELEELTGFSVYGGTGEVLDKDVLTHIYNGFDEDSLRELTERARENGSDIQYYTGLPDAVKNNLPELDEMLESGFFDIPRYNDSILGTTKMRRSVQPYMSTNPIANAKNALEQVGIFVQPKYEYINNIMDSAFSISNGAYKNYSDAEILEGLIRTNGQYRLITLVEDKRWGMRIREIQPLNIESIAEARRLNAVVVPYAVYTKMINTVNHRIGGSGFFKLWNRVMYLYKFGYLINIGTIARNWIDTNLKTDLELGTEARGFKRMARDYIRQYKDIHQRVAEMNDGIVTRRGIERYFAGEYPTVNNTIDQATYFMLEDFFRFGPVTNISQEPNLMNMGDGNLWRTFTDKTGALMSAANWTEASNRLAIYLADLNKGIAKHDAWAHISRVHFDYSFKTPTEQLVEALFPFSTFMFRNIQYWVDMLERHPEYIPLFRDIYTPIWNFDERTPEELEYSWALQYQIINGSISLFEANDTDYVLRINPSIFDAIGTIVNPLTIIQNKLAAPITDLWSVLTGESKPDIEMLPVIGTIYQRIDKAQREQNILPSLITKRSTSQTAPNYTMWRNNNLNNYYGIENTSNPYYVLPKTRMDSRIDPLRTIGTRAFTSRMMARPKVKVDVDVYENVYYRHYTNVYSGIRYQLMLNVNRFR